MSVSGTGRRWLLASVLAGLALFSCSGESDDDGENTAGSSSIRAGAGQGGTAAGSGGASAGRGGSAPAGNGGGVTEGGSDSSSLGGEGGADGNPGGQGGPTQTGGAFGSGDSGAPGDAGQGGSSVGEGGAVGAGGSSTNPAKSSEEVAAACATPLTAELTVDPASGWKSAVLRLNVTAPSCSLGSGPSSGSVEDALLFVREENSNYSIWSVFPWEYQLKSGRGSNDLPTDELIIVFPFLEDVRLRVSFTVSGDSVTVDSVTPE